MKFLFFRKFLVSKPDLCYMLHIWWWYHVHNRRQFLSLERGLILCRPLSIFIISNNGYNVKPFFKIFHAWGI